MRSSFRGSIAGLALTLTIALVVSANVAARSATGRASATVIAPVTISRTLQADQADSSNGLTRDLILHLPVAGPSWVDEVESAALLPETSVPVAIVPDGCVQRTGSLANCLVVESDDRMLEPGLTSGLEVKVAEGAQSGTANVSVTVLYN